MRVRDLIEDLHAQDKSGGMLPLCFEHEGKVLEVAQFEICCGKVVLKTWPIPPGISAPAR
jgi:hypothetical protein